MNNKHTGDIESGSYDYESWKITYTSLYLIILEMSICLPCAWYSSNE